MSWDDETLLEVSAARLAAFALAIWSLKAAEDFRLDATEGDTDESPVIAVLPDTVDELDGIVSEVAEDL